MLTFKEFVTEKTTAPSAGGGKITETHNGVRRGPLNQRLRSVISNGLAGTGLNWHSFSGGQPSSGPNRVGGPRHNDGNASDGDFKDVSGRTLNADNPADRSLIAQALGSLRKAGLQGIGWDSKSTGKGHYMGSQRFHLDVYGPGIWGSSKSSNTAAPWIIQAIGGITPQEASPLIQGDEGEATQETDTESDSDESGDYETSSDAIAAFGQGLQTILKGGVTT